MGEFDHIAKALQDTPIFTLLQAMAESGDYSALETEARRHHYVPRFLLRGFSHPYHDKPHVWQADLRSNRAPIRVGLRSAAVREDLYTVVNEDGTTSTRLEGWLALIEAHAASALRTLLDEPTALMDEDRMTIAFFVATQWMRTPLAAQQVTALANAAFRTAASEIYSDRSAFAERYRELFGEEASVEEIEEFRLESISQIRDGRLELRDRGGTAFGYALRIAVEQVPMLYAFDWLLLRAPGGVITSDRGIALHDPAPPYPWSTPGLLSSPAVEVSMPLADDACLLLRPEPIGPRLNVQGIDDAGVTEINLRTISWAGRHIFGSTIPSLLRARDAAKKKPHRAARPKPYCMVYGFELDPDDNSLAHRNERLGYPPQLIDQAGEPHDYIVIPIDGPHPELRALADEVAEHRARKRAGIADDQPIEGRLIHEAMHPLNFRPFRGAG